ncbi:EAL domain-containing protein [Hyphomonas chukchiensis]|uniref:EAL domain-containing protein n=1 Tax=Hyphomonas chukchiensis TaxID=1280947 RepID=UPI0030F77704
MLFESAPIQKTPALTRDMGFHDVAAFFRQYPDATLCPVVDTHAVPIGYVSSMSFQTMLASPFGHALHEKKKIHSLMKCGADFPSIRDRIADVIGRYISDDRTIRDGLVLVGPDGRYHGIMSGLHVFEAMNTIHTSMLAKLTLEIAERKVAEQKIKSLADEDPLTGILNRRAFVREVDAHIARGIPFACAFVDLDRFKHLNDRYGHAVGDEVLKTISNRLSNNAALAHAARLGGDEFAFVVRASGGSAAIQQILEDTQAELIRGIDSAVGQVFVGASIGYAIHLMDTFEQAAMLHAADKSMLRIKAQGGGVARFNRALDIGSQEADMVDLALVSAVANKRFEPAFQPILDVRTGRIVGHEMLARWPQSGLQTDPMPSQFIQAAERLGLIDPLFWSLADKAVASMDDSDTFLALNISPSQLCSDHFLDKLDSLVTRHRVDPARLELEVTEHIYFSNLDLSTEILSKVRAMGVSVALDDFGTGYSSLKLIDQLPIDKIKIDRSFVAQEGGKTVRGTILKATIALCKELGIKSCTEGIETRENLHLIAQLGCDLAQGYLIGRPEIRGKAPPQENRLSA